MTAGDQFLLVGFQRGVFGSVSPDVVFRGARIDDLLFRINTSETIFALLGTTAVPPDDDSAFESIRIRGDFVGGPQDYTLLRANADSNAIVGLSRAWTYGPGTTQPFITGNDYEVELR